MRILYNKERFDPTKYGDDRIIKESGMSKMQFDPRSPSFLMLNFMLQELEDETDYIQFGQIDEIKYHQINLDQQLPSSWTDDLIKNPDGKYKFASLHLQVDD